MNNKLGIIHISLPHFHDKHERWGRTCKNCTCCFWEEGKWCCNEHDQKPARNPRARALKCQQFEHWTRSNMFRAFNQK